MGIRSTISRLLRGEWRSDSTLRDPHPWLIDILGGSKTSAGERITEASAMRVGAVYACVRNIAEDVAKLPLPVYQRIEPRGRLPIGAHPLHQLLNVEPNPSMSGMDLRSRLVADAVVGGNGYAEIERDGSGRVVALHPIKRERVRPFNDAGGVTAYRVDGEGGVTLRQREMFHLRGFGDGFIGWALADLSREAVALAMAAEKMAGSFFGNGLNPSAVLEHPSVMSDEARANLIAGIMEMHAGADKGFGILPLEEDMKLKPWSVSPDKAQAIEHREFSVQEIARWFRMPPHKIGMLKDATFSNIEQQSIEYVVDTLQPWLTRFEHEANRKLLNPGERSQLYVKHKVAGLLRGDAAARSAFYREQFNVGALSPNDIRELEDLNPYEGGDVYLVNGAIRTVQSIAALPADALTPSSEDPTDAPDA